MKKIVSLILGVIMSVSISALTSCKKVNTATSWQIVSYQSGSESMTQQVGFNVTRSSKKIREIWMKIDKIELESVTITFERYTSSTTDSGTSTMKPVSGTSFSKVITSKQVKEAKKNANGWIKVNDENWDKDYTYVLMSTTGNITIDEVVFVSEENKRLTTNVDKANIVIEYNDGKTESKVFTKAQLEEIKDAKYGLPLNLVNNQESFDKK